MIFVIYILLCLLFMIFGGYSEGVMDTIQFHYIRSVFVDKKKQQFWNPNRSWMNKYKDLDSTKGERFWGSSTIFVFVTDAWHLYKFFRTTSIFISMFFMTLCLIKLSIFLSINIFLPIFISLLLLRVIFGISFTLSYRKLSNKNKK